MAPLPRAPPPRPCSLDSPPPMKIKRAVTMPVTHSPSTADDGKESLFSSRSARIISFAPVSTASPRSAWTPSRRACAADTRAAVGTLPWASRTERMIGNGTLQIYRNHAVAFLDSGSIPHPLLPKSQCWCVDGECKFVLRIRNDAYWRIELRSDSAAGRQEAEAIKAVLDSILLFEKTPCPFKRGFTVELPDEPETPVKKVPWRALERTRTVEVEPVAEPRFRPDDLSEDPSWNSSVTGRGLVTTEDAQSDAFDTSRPRSTMADPLMASNDAVDSIEQTAERQTKALDSTACTSSADDGHDFADDGHDFAAEADQDDEDDDQSALESNDGFDATPRASTTLPPNTRTLDLPETPTRPRALAGARSITAPPHLSLTTTPPAQTPATSAPSPADPPTLDHIFSSASLASSVDSFHSFFSAAYSLPPSPPDSTTSSPFPEDVFRSDATPRRPRRLDPAAHSSPDRTTASIWDQPLPSPSKRSLSPLPLPANLVLAAGSGSDSGHHLTTALIQKACSLLRRSPTVFVTLLLGLARLIQDGTVAGVGAGYGAELERRTLRWRDGGDRDAGELGEEDDYGVPVQTKREGRRRRGRAGDQ